MTRSPSPPGDARPPRRLAPGRRSSARGLVALAVVGAVLAGCSSAGLPTAGGSGATPAASVSPAIPTEPATWPPTTPGPSTSGPAGASASSEAIEAKPGTSKIVPVVQVFDGYASMYVSLQNRATEALTFINTLYDTEPDKLWTPQVTIPYAAGGNALVTRAGRFFPSPAIVPAGGDAVYIMGGQQLAMGQPANGTAAFAGPVTNIKACLTRGMDDRPGVPLDVKDVTWSDSGGVTTVRGTLVETQGSQRPSLPMIGVAFFDASGVFLGAVVDARGGDAMAPHSTQAFEISGRGVDTSRVARVEAHAVIP